MPEERRLAVERWVEAVAAVRRPHRNTAADVWQDYDSDLERLARKGEAMEFAVAKQLDEHPHTLGKGYGSRAIRWLASTVANAADSEVAAWRSGKSTRSGRAKRKRHDLEEARRAALQGPSARAAERSDGSDGDKSGGDVTLPY